MTAGSREGPGAWRGSSAAPWSSTGPMAISIAGPVRAWTSARPGRSCSWLKPGSPRQGRDRQLVGGPGGGGPAPGRLAEHLEGERLRRGAGPRSPGHVLRQRRALRGAVPHAGAQAVVPAGRRVGLLGRHLRRPRGGLLPRRGGRGDAVPDAAPRHRGRCPVARPMRRPRGAGRLLQGTARRRAHLPGRPERQGDLPALHGVRRGPGQEDLPLRLPRHPRRRSIPRRARSSPTWTTAAWRRWPAGPRSR